MESILKCVTVGGKTMVVKRLVTTGTMAQLKESDSVIVM
jgi:hypothetical protein